MPLPVLPGPPCGKIVLLRSDFIPPFSMDLITRHKDFPAGAILRQDVVYDLLGPPLRYWHRKVYVCSVEGAPLIFVQNVVVAEMPVIELRRMLVKSLYHYK